MKTFWNTTWKGLSVCVLIALASCNAPQPNTLTEVEKANGWQLLFDGKTLDGWKDYNGETLTQPWHVVDGCIQANGDGSDLSGYIVTKISRQSLSRNWIFLPSISGRKEP